MRRALALVASALVALLAAAPALAQDSSPGAPPEAAPPPAALLELDWVRIDDHPEVRLLAGVPFDVASGPVPPEAFALFEDDERREVRVSPLPEDQLEVVMLIDHHRSMGWPAPEGATPLDGAKAAAASLVHRLAGGAQIAMLGYTEEITAATPLTTDVGLLIGTLESLEADGPSSTYSALASSLGHFSDRDDVRRAVVLLTEGEDHHQHNPTGTALDEVRARLAAWDGALYVVEYTSLYTDSPALQQLVDTTGGRLVQAGDPEALLRVYGEIAAELANHYELAYTSGAHGPTRLRVVVEHDGRSAEAAHRVEMPAQPRPEAAAPAPAPPPRRGIVIDPGLFATEGAMFAGVAAFYVALTLLVLAVASPRGRRSRLHRAGPGGSRPVGGLAGWATETAERGLDRHGKTGAVNAALESAGINLRVGEFVVLSASIAVTAGALGATVGGLLGGVVLALLTVLGVRLGLSVAATRRKGRFAEQLGDTLTLLAGSLRAGHSLLQAVDAVAKEADPPTSDEFRRLIVETRLGRPLPDTLQALATRMESEDFAWVVQAIIIHREVGGDLAAVLDNVARTIRERNQIKRQVKALSAEGRLSALVLMALPFAVAGFVSFTNPSYLALLFEPPVGWALLATGGFLMTVGGLWLRKIVKVVF